MVYFNYFICDYRHPYDVNAWDLMKHNCHYLIMMAGGLMIFCEKQDPYENAVKCLSFIFIWGVLLNCIIFNLQGDRNFHWYSILLVLLSLGGGFKKGWPELHKKVLLKLFTEKTYNYLFK